jgi:hypothetical protein
MTVGKKLYFLMKQPFSYLGIQLNIGIRVLDEFGLFLKNQQKILAWGGFCIKGKTSLFCFTQIMDAKFYIEILQQHIWEVRRMLGRRWRFQQDNDPKHTSRLAKEFLQENVPEVID